MAIYSQDAPPSKAELGEVKRLFRYRHRDGALVSRTTGVPISKNNGRYIQVRFGARTVVAHKVVWYLVKGVWPGHGIDHRDGDTFNNRIRNLRAADQSENSQNLRGAKSSNKLGLLGVREHKPGVYRAAITLRGVRYDLGCFKDPLVAHQRYLEVKRSIHPFSNL